jgi:hypothetical protein
MSMIFILIQIKLSIHISNKLLETKSKHKKKLIALDSVQWCKNPSVHCDKFLDLSRVHDFKPFTTYHTVTLIIMYVYLC